ncbi:MAG: polysulfide reductase NrfD [Elusimicrobia bacterium]|nr:polysulfide reductase NrfD [Elusimicrobiota bacterium]
MSEHAVSTLRRPLIDGGKDYARVSEDVCSPIERGPTSAWYYSIAASSTVLMIGVFLVVDQIWTGIGTWGLNKTVGWAFDITNFVFWVGIGHAGTLISAILFLFRQRWRTSVNRSAEAMTLFAVMCAGVFPLIHMGRPWLAYWVFPYPNTMGPLWVNFRSPLLWDVFAISTYFTVSAIFWYMGLLPDLALVAERANGWRRKIFRAVSLGWDGSMRTWTHYEALYLLLAGLATPLVLSVHTIVSFDFATAVLPGWHTTIFPPYFVDGAIFSGFAMVMTLMIIARKVMNFEEYITLRHIDAMCKITLATGMILTLGYCTELFFAWYGSNPYERFTFLNRLFGPYRWCYYTMFLCNAFIPQALWSKRVRTTPWLVFIISICINIGMWLERFNIIVISLHRDFLPSSWTMYHPTYIEVGTLCGSFGLFFTAFLLFCRVLPMIAISEVKGVLHYARRPEEGAHGH